MFKGSNVALITPFKNNELDVEAYIKLFIFKYQMALTVWCLLEQQVNRQH